MRSQTLAPKAETLPQKAQDPVWSLRVGTPKNTLKPEAQAKEDSAGERTKSSLLSAGSATWSSQVEHKGKIPRV